MIYKRIGLYLGMICALQASTQDLQAVSMRNFWIGTSIGTAASALVVGGMYYWIERQVNPEKQKKSSLALKTLAVALLAGGTAGGALTALSLYEFTPSARLKSIKKFLQAMHQETLAQATYTQDNALMNAIITTYRHDMYPLLKASYKLENLENKLRTSLKTMQQVMKDVNDQPELANECEQIMRTLRTYITQVTENSVHLRRSYNNQIHTEKNAARLEVYQDRALSIEERKANASEISAGAQKQLAHAETVRVIKETGEFIQKVFK